jgi:hypothetical protein
MSARGHIHTADTQWMEWLRKCSRREGLSGRTLYEEYSTQTTAWDDSVQILKTDICPGWTFCRGAMALSSADIAAARHRYLDRYPLTYENRDSGRYIDALLEIDACQTRLRQCPEQSGGCQGCMERDRTIGRLQLALSAGDVVDETAITGKMMTSIFHRHFLLDGGHTSRTEVRETMERVLQQEIGPDETLPSSSPTWGTFLRNTLGVSGANSKPIRCRRRAHPIERHGVL